MAVWSFQYPAWHRTRHARTRHTVMKGDDSSSPAHTLMAYFYLFDGIFLCILLHKEALPKCGIPELEIIMNYQCSLKTGRVLRLHSIPYISHKCNSHSSHAPIFLQLITQRKNWFFSVLATHWYQGTRDQGDKTRSPSYLAREQPCSIFLALCQG